jgi:hypothetical protein
MPYQPTEATLLKGLQQRAASRESQYASLMGLARPSFETTARNYGVPFEGRVPHEIACDIVDVLYPEAHDASQAAQNVVSGPNLFNDTMLAQAATTADLHRFRDVIGVEQLTMEPDDNWPIDVPERMAGVGYKAADGTICPLDSEGSVLLSGWGPDQVRFLLVSLSQFFDGDYVRKLMTDLYIAVCDGIEEVRVVVVEALNEQGWLDEASAAYADVQARRQLIYNKTANDTDSWTTDSVAQEYPVVGTGDAPTEFIEAINQNQYKPGPY